MNTPRLEPRVLSVLAMLACGCNNKLGERPSPPPVPASVAAQGAPVSSPTRPADALVPEAVSRLRAAMPPSGDYCILLVIGSGEAAAKAAAGLREALEREPRVRFARVTPRPAPPVEDPHSPGGHVNAVEYVIEPRPHMVVSVSESQGRYYFAAREPGADPLGPSSDWLWVLSSP
jgi:hypothetical protein